MAAKKNKAKKPSKNKTYTKNDYWFQLTQQILQLLPKNRNKNTLRCVSNSSEVTKSWVPTTNRCGGEQRPPRLLRMDDSAYFKYFSSDCPFTAQRVESWVNGQMFYRNMNQLELAKYGCNLADPFRLRRDPLFQKIEKNCMEITGTVSCEGKTYALSLQGTLVVVEMIDSRCTIIGAASNRAVPSLSCRFFKEYLVEIGGEIVIIFLIHQTSLGIVDCVEVFRLCLHGLKWVKAEGIGGKILFLDPEFLCADAAEIGCNGNCIYFTQASYSGWLVYDMESGSISCLTTKISYAKF